MNLKLDKSHRFLGSIALLLLPVVAEPADLEWRPAIAGGYCKIVESHGSISAALRVQPLSFLLVQAEYLALPTTGHTDHGFTFMAGLSGTRRDGFRPYAAFGGGPVNGYQDDDGILYFALGASYPIGRSQRAFVQGEARFGVLGESSYSQFTLGFGLSR